mmetsp:Transcript_43769/g.79105  ORF Transcript_43769/g.79105 Transcript_43769/m.79105 type:complete len:301 (+) Transcript_43769:502-1404(+)
MALLHLVDKDHEVGQTGHLLDALVLLCEPVELALETELLVIRQDAPGSLCLVFPELEHESDARPHGLEVGKQTSDIPQVAEVCTGALSGRTDDRASLLLGADHEEGGALGSSLHHVVASSVEACGRLHQVEDVRAIRVGVEVLHHLGAPRTGLVAVLDTCSNELLQSDALGEVLGHLPAGDGELLEPCRLQILSDVERVVHVMAVAAVFAPGDTSAFRHQRSGIGEVLRRKLELHPAMQLLLHNILHAIQGPVLPDVALDVVLDDIPRARSVNHGLLALRRRLERIVQLPHPHRNPGRSP